MAWVYLLLAGAAEIGWMISLRYAEGFTRPLALAATVVLMGISLVFLSLAIRTIPMGTAYALWTGVGASGIAIIGIVFYQEPATLLRVACIGLIICGMIGLKVASA